MVVLNLKPAVEHLKQVLSHLGKKDSLKQAKFTADSGFHSEKMKVKIDSTSGRRQYSKRLVTIEPMFGNIMTNKSMNRLTLRGQEKVNAQWQVFCLVHNIEKLRSSLH